MHSNDFDKILLTAVEEGLSSLGESSKQAILFRLDTFFNIKEESIPANLTEFSKALEGIFGPGASYLEKLIARRLCEKLGIGFEDRSCSDFLECVDSMKRSFKPKGECVLR